MNKVAAVTLGDLLTKPATAGGLDLGTIGSSLCLATVLVVLVTVTSLRDKSARGIG